MVLSDDILTDLQVKPIAVGRV